MSNTNYVAYNGDGVTTSFAVTFDFLRSSDLQVEVGGVATTFTMSGDNVVISPAPAAGTNNVVITRVTAVNAPYAVFTDDAAWLAADMNGALDQVLYAVQDAHIRIDGLNVAVGGGGGSTVLAPNAVNDFLVAQTVTGVLTWKKMDLASVQSLLGISTPVTVPTPVAGHYFIVSSLATNDYGLKSIAEVKTLLGVTGPGVSIDAVNNRANYFLMTDPTGTFIGYNNASTARGYLGLGTAALLDVGTSANRIVQLDGSAKLPAVDGSQLLGVAKALDYCLYTQTASKTIAASGSGYTNVYGSSNLTATTTTIRSDSTWNSAVSTGLQLTSGTYHIRVEWTFKGGETHPIGNAKVYNVTDAADIITLLDSTLLSSGPASNVQMSIETTVVLSATKVVSFYAIGVIAGSGTLPSSRIHVWKLA